ncbi:MAG: hypothetical protein EX271_11300 [Acidimicrobiales bacterium]|nr:hypothetical protein [Hyphomonadaceae bacterium]RZV37975.1 MAG: hypothetical protein EX271_11300 [Acidimicrobiales bacterium]
MKTTSNITIEAPASLVFLWLEDADRLKQWVPNLIEDEALVETPEKVGSKFRQVFSERGKEMVMIGEITEYIENERMRVDICGDMFDLDLQYSFKAEGAARTHLTQETSIKFKGMMKLLTPIFAVMNIFMGSKAQDEALSRMKQLAEAEHKGA